jgi:hypothetical protein
MVVFWGESELGVIVPRSIQGVGRNLRTRREGKRERERAGARARERESERRG